MRRSLFLMISLAVGMPGCGSADQKPQQVHGKPIDQWVRALKETNPTKRRQAVRVLGNVGMAEEGIMPALILAVKDPAPEVRLEAVTALEKLGTNAKDAIPALTKAQKDDDARVRLRAAEALRRVSAS